MCHHCTQGMQRDELQEAPVLEIYLQPLSPAEQNNNKLEKVEGEELCLSHFSFKQT